MVSQPYYNASAAGSAGSTAAGIAGDVVTGGLGIVSSAVGATITGLFNKGLVKQQKDAVALQEKVSLLSNSQQDLLNQQLAQTSDDNQKLEILLNAVGNVQAAQVTQSTANQTTMALIILGGALALVVTIYFIKKAS